MTSRGPPALPQWAQTRVTGSPPHFAAVGAWRPRNLAPPVLAAGEDPAAAMETLAAANPAGLDIVDEGADATEDLCLGELPPHRLRYGLDQGVGRIEVGQGVVGLSSCGHTRPRTPKSPRRRPTAPSRRDRNQGGPPPPPRPSAEGWPRESPAGTRRRRWA